MFRRWVILGDFFFQGTMSLMTQEIRQTETRLFAQSKFAIVEELKTNLMSRAILFHFLCAQHVRTLIYPSSGVCDYSVELPHWSYCSWFDVCWSFGVVGLEWYLCCRLQPATQIPLQPNFFVFLCSPCSLHSAFSCWYFLLRLCRSISL